MATLTIRKLDDSVKSRLRIEAARHGRSMEMEAREILRRVLEPGPPRARDFAAAIRRHLTPPGGVELAIPAREPLRTPPDFRK